MDDFLAIFFGALGTLLTALITWGTQRLISLLNNKIRIERHECCIRCAVGLIESVVKQTNQTYVESAKSQNSWGLETQKQALAASLNTVQSLLSDEVKKHIFETYGDVTVWITNQIEAKIYELKKAV